MSKQSPKYPKSGPPRGSHPPPYDPYRQGYYEEDPYQQNTHHQYPGYDYRRDRYHSHQPQPLPSYFGDYPYPDYSYQTSRPYYPSGHVYQDYAPRPLGRRELDNYLDYSSGFYPSPRPPSHHPQYSENDSRYYQGESEYGSYPPEENGMVYEVRFKCTKDTYRLDPRSRQEILVGDTVIVETDRGLDAGIVAAIQPADIPMASMYANTMSTLRRIIHRATDEEMATIKENREEEEKALQLCRHLALMRHLPMVVAATEMQFDRRKLTIIFSADRRVDFRELVRDMFQVFKTRIWMQKVSPAEATALSSLFPTAPLPPQGVPIPQTRSLISIPALTADPREHYPPYPPDDRQISRRNQMPEDIADDYSGYGGSGPDSGSPRDPYQDGEFSFAREQSDYYHHHSPTELNQLSPPLVSSPEKNFESQLLLDDFPHPPPKGSSPEPLAEPEIAEEQDMHYH